MFRKPMGQYKHSKNNSVETFWSVEGRPAKHFEERGLKLARKIFLVLEEKSQVDMMGGYQEGWLVPIKIWR